MPQTINFPSSLDDDNSLYLVVNNLRTRLTSGITDTTTTIPVLTTSGFPEVGFLTILTGSDITKAEAIAYSGTDPSNFFNAERGADLTTPLPHNPSDNVDLTIVARHHNNVKDAIIEIEKYIGVSGSENFVPFVDGNVVLPGTLSVQEALTVSGGATICFLTVTGTLEVFGDSDFNNVVVSGCLDVGDFSPTTDPVFTYQFDDTDANITSVPSDPSTKDTGFQSGTFAVGKQLVLFQAQVAPDGTNNAAYRLRTIIGGTEYNHSGSSAGPSGVDASYMGNQLSSFVHLDFGGTETLKYTVSRDTSGGTGTTAIIGNQGFVSIPLEDMGLVEDTDYFYHHGTETENTVNTTFFVDMPDGTLTFTAPVTGEYLVLSSVEHFHGINGSVRWLRDGSVIGGQAQTFFSRFNTSCLVTTTTLTQGVEYDFRLQQLTNTAFGATGRTRRARWFVMPVANFDQLKISRSTTDQSTTSTTYQNYSPVETTYASNTVGEQLLVIGHAIVESADASDTPMGALEIRNDTNSLSYRTDTGRRGADAADGSDESSWLFHVQENVPNTSETWQLRFRNPEATSDIVEVQEGTLVLWSQSLPTGSTDVIDFTRIKQEKITTPCITTEEILVKQDLTISGTTFANNLVTITGTFNEVNVTEELTATSGTFTSGLSVCDDADFKTNVTISGCLIVGEIPSGGSIPITYLLDETTHDATSGSFADIGVETAPVKTGKNLLIYGASAGGTSQNTEIDIRCLFAGSTVGESEGFNPQDGGGNEAFAGCGLAGFKIITGDDVNTVKLQARRGGGTGKVSAASILAIPFEDMGLIEGTDYWFDNGSDSETDIDGSGALTTLSMTLPETGDYLVLASVEAHHTGNSTMNVDLRLDTAAIGPQQVLSGGTSLDSVDFSWVQLINTTAGPHDFDIFFDESVAGVSRARRGRIIVIKASSFDQIVNVDNTTNQNTSSTTFAKVSASEISYTPNQTETIVVLANPDGFVSSAPATAPHITYKLVNETDVEEYMVDAGTNPYRSTTSRFASLLFAKLDDVSSAKTFSLSFREPQGTGHTGTNNNNSMIVWGLSTNVIEKYQFTTIKGDKITAPCIDADAITVSGMPVSTGTGGGGASDINSINGITSGDITVSGAGTVVVTTSGQVIIVSGTGAAGGGGGSGDGCFTHEQVTAASAWTVNHNLGTEKVNYIVLDTADSQVEPDSFTVDTQDQVTITFASSQDGKAHIFPCGDAASGTVTLQQAYDNGDGTISTTGGKPLELTGTGELVAVTGTFTSGLTVGSASTHITEDMVSTAGLSITTVEQPVYMCAMASGTTIDLMADGQMSRAHLLARGPESLVDICSIGQESSVHMRAVGSGTDIFICAEGTDTALTLAAAGSRSGITVTGTMDTEFLSVIPITVSGTGSALNAQDSGRSFGIPRRTNDQKDAEVLGPDDGGRLLWNTTSGTLNLWDGISWIEITGGDIMGIVQQGARDATSQDWNVRDDFDEQESLEDQAGTGGVLTFSFSSDVNLVVVETDSDTLLSRATINSSETPTSTKGVKLSDYPVAIPGITDTVKVFAPIGVTVSVYGLRRI